jgi:hypothetical protein
MNKRVLVASLQDNGELTEKNFKFTETPIPSVSDLKDNEGNSWLLAALTISLSSDFVFCR